MKILRDLVLKCKWLLPILLAFALSPGVSNAAGSKKMFSLDNTDFVVLISFLIFVGVLIYFKVPSIIAEFLESFWEDKFHIAKHFKDPRMKEIAHLMIYHHKPEVLPNDIRKLCVEFDPKNHSQLTFFNDRELRGKYQRCRTKTTKRKSDCYWDFICGRSWRDGNARLNAHRSINLVISSSSQRLMFSK